MKVLITGAEGFVGGHLARYLLAQPDVTVFGTTFFPPQQFPQLSQMGVQLCQLDLADEELVLGLLKDLRPDHIYHLAAQSFVPESFENPWKTLSNNIQSQLNLLHNVVKLNLSPRILVVGSAEEYGAVSPDDMPINEQQELRPGSPYSVSKVAQDMLGLQYHLSHDLPVIRVRPFNHIGPGQSDRFVAAAFASQIAAIEKRERDPVLYVGNLDARRDFTDVRDMVRAYHLVMTLGEPGAVYNIGSGQAHSIQEMLDVLLHMADAPIRVQSDPARTRPVEVPIIVCDNRKIRATTGWEPAFAFEDTMADILNDWRERLGVVKS